MTCFSSRRSLVAVRIVPATTFAATAFRFRLVRRRHLRSDFRSPGVQLFLQRLGLLGMPGSEVVLLTCVGAEVVELDLLVLEELEELEVADANGADGQCSPAVAGAEVAGEVPVDRVTLRRFGAVAGERGKEADAVERLFVRL